MSEEKLNEDNSTETNIAPAGPVERVVIQKCAYCKKEIKHYHGRLWHEVNAIVFPQYCRKSNGGDSRLHSPIIV